MRLARRAIAIFIGFAAGFFATATVAYASLTVRDPAVMPADTTTTSAAGRPLWQILVALGVLLAVVIVGLGYSRSRSRKSQTSPQS